MGKNLTELVLGQKIRLSAIIGFEVCEKYLLKPQGEKTRKQSLQLSIFDGEATHHIVDFTQSIRTACSCRRQTDCEIQSRDQYNKWNHGYCRY